MIKRIPLSALTLGMYIHDLNCGWMDHPFARGRFLVRTNKDLERVRSLSIQSIYIDTDKGKDVPGAPSQAAVEERQQQAIDELLSEPLRDAAPEQPSNFDQEFSRAKSIADDAQQVVSDLMRGARVGKQIRIEQADAVVDQLARSLMRNPDALLALGQIRDVDRYTFEHSVHVCTLMVAFALQLGCDTDQLHEIGVGALLHDIGKVRIDDRILNKPGRLTDDEFRIMQSHVVHSKLILGESGAGNITLAVAAEHHERYDGSGYPNRLKGEQISRFGQMTALADVYDALTSDRCYHAAMLPTQALRRLYEWSSHQFNPELTQRFIRFIGIYPAGSFVELKSGRMALVLDRCEDRLHPRVRLIYDLKRKRLVSPTDEDLSQSEDVISGYADPKRYGLDPHRLLARLL